MIGVARRVATNDLEMRSYVPRARRSRRVHTNQSGVERRFSCFFWFFSGTLAERLKQVTIEMLQNC